MSTVVVLLLVAVGVTVALLLKPGERASDGPGEGRRGSRGALQEVDEALPDVDLTVLAPSLHPLRGILGPGAEDEDDASDDGGSDDASGSDDGGGDGD